jgi:predicted helicase
MSGLHEILEEFRDAALSKRDLGDRFERLFAGFLVTEPIFKERFSNVWLWSEWPGRGKKTDTGIDLVAEERYGGGYCAIQCKFFAPGRKIEKADLDSFFATSGKDPRFTSRIVVSTTDHWSKHAEDLLDDPKVQTQRIRLQDLDGSAIDWSQFSLKRPDKMKLRPRHSLRDHQKAALDQVLGGLRTADRGRLIMACGTGKTFTALRIAERFAAGARISKDSPPSHGRILFLVPSIALLGQALSEWSAHAEHPMVAFAVCSDTAVGKKVRKGEDTAEIRLHDLPFPATTDPKILAKQLGKLGDSKKLSVIFSTYQSLATIHEAQKRHGAPEFDLAICDEAHRTTGVTLAEDESHFVRIHDANYVRARKRLYMTATPRIYMDSAKTKAAEASAELASMDDPAIFGEELHRLGFGEAIEKELLSDYKVLVLAVDERYVSRTFQQELAAHSKKTGKAFDDLFSDYVKITGCWNGLGKRMAAGEDDLLGGDTAPMRRAVAFARSIAASKQVQDLFSRIVERYIEEAPDSQRGQLLRCEVDHVDGTMNALERARRLEWLKEETPPDSPACRILTNARCLSEGVDVPALDAVLFLNPRNSVVDVVQAVGRVMRRAEGKKYGYIVLPIGVPADTPPEQALQDNERYKVIWQVLQALRSHDERLEATINAIDLSGKSSGDPDGRISIIGVGAGPGEDLGDADPLPTPPTQILLPFPNLEAWRDAIFAKIVLRCGDRRYWESWAKDVAQIAQRQIEHIESLLASPKSPARGAFESFLTGLRTSLNPAVTAKEAVEMLAQHLITRPVFDALFEDYAFAEHNPVSQSMQKMLDVLDEHGLGREAASLEKFYESVRRRASQIHTPEARQRVIVELYDKFFRTAFPRMADRLGIVYTPVEIVDFILKSVDDTLRSEFRESLASQGVQVLDPFTGTGTFIVRLLQGGFVGGEDLPRKYAQELHANEIVLLAYYIAAVNIEAAYHDALAATGQPASYTPFEGIVLTDTFQLTEGKDAIDDPVFQSNNARARRQNAADIRVVVGNPPYSAQQESENDANKNLKYPALDERIRTTYATRSNAGLLKNLYDSYIRAIRWASDRVKERGIVCFVTNGSFIDANNMDGLRLTLAEEFSRVYVFNLRGNARTQGEQRRKEAGSVFGAGTRTPVAITLLVKNPDQPSDRRIRYHDIGDYLSREEKLATVRAAGSVSSLSWTELHPNKHGDWINVRDPAFAKFIPLGDKESDRGLRIFETYSQGVLTARDAWAYNFSAERLTANMAQMIESYNAAVEHYHKLVKGRPRAEWPAPEAVVDRDPRKISWSSTLLPNVGRGRRAVFSAKAVTPALYRPFQKQWLYFDPMMNDRLAQWTAFCPDPRALNRFISATGIGASKDFSALVSDVPPNYHALDTGQHFPLYYYEDAPANSSGNLFDGTGSSRWTRRDAITDDALALFRSTYAATNGAAIGKEDLFYYVYGVLHSSEYKSRFEADLKKQIPRIPLAKDFWSFSKAGRELAHWHLNYETVEPYPLQATGHLELGGTSDLYRVQRMTWARKRVDGKLVDDKTTLVYNSKIGLSGIPRETFEYVVNGKPAIEWVLERYQVTVDKDSGIVNDPNDWATEHGDPEYIFNLVRRVVRVSVETVRIVKELPALEELPGPLG